MNAMVTPSTATDSVPKKRKVLVAGSRANAALALAAAAAIVNPAGGGFTKVQEPPKLLEIASKAGLFVPVPKSQPLTEEQEDRVIAKHNKKQARRAARNFKNKANGGFTA